MRLLSSLSAFALAALTALPVAAETADIQQELSTYNDRYNQIAADYDLEAFLALYGEDPLWIAPGKPAVAGLDVPAGAFGFITESEADFSHSFDRFFVSDDGTQAVMIGTYDMAAEKVGVTAQGTYLFVLQRDGEGWAIVAAMFNQRDPE